MKVGIFYGSTTGNTEKAANLIKDALGGIVSGVHDVKSCSADDFEDYDALILGTSTWDEGQLQEDWESFMGTFDEVDLSGKKVALFGLGDAQNYAEYFVDAMGALYDKVTEKGADVVGHVGTDGYQFDKSTAARGGQFVGLPLDEDNEADLTESRIASWCTGLKSALS